MIIIATLGFDERPVIRSMAETGFENIDRIVLICPHNTDQRAVKAISEIMRIASIASIRNEDIVVHRVNVNNFWKSVASIYKLILKYYEEGGNILLCLSGGLRALILESYTAFILIPLSLKKNIKLRIDLETGLHTIFLHGSEIVPSINRSDIEYMILEIVRRSPGANLTIISRKIDKPVSTTHRILKRLLDQGLIRREGNKYYLADAGEVLLVLKREITYLNK